MTAVKIWILFNMFLASVVLARAQEQAAPRERALMQRIGSEVNSNLVCAANAEALQDKIKELTAENEKLKKPADAPTEK